MSMLHEGELYSLDNLFREKGLNYAWQQPSLTNDTSYLMNISEMKSIDVHDIGTLTHFLLAASYPVLPVKDIENVSTAANDFIRRLLSYKINCKQALHHQWMKCVNGVQGRTR
eukprot:UN11113